MIFEPIELELDRKRKFKLTARALMRAEDTVNRRRGVKPNERVSIDYLVYKARMDSVLGTGSAPRDLIVTLIWSGLVDLWPKTGDEEEPGLTVEKVEELIYETSPLTVGDIITMVFDHYSEVVNKKKAEPIPAQPNGADESPLAQRPGSTSGVMQ